MKYEYSDKMVDWVVGEYRRLKGQVDEGREGWMDGRRLENGRNGNGRSGIDSRRH